MKLSMAFTALVGSLFCISPIFGQDNSTKAIETGMILLIYQVAVGTLVVLAISRHPFHLGSIDVEQELQKLPRFDIKDLKLLFHCNILIPKKCPCKTPFKAQFPLPTLIWD